MSKTKAIKLITLGANDALFRVRGTVGQQYAQAARVHGINTDSHKIQSNFRKCYPQFKKIYPNFGKTVGMTSRQWWDLVIKASFSGYQIEPVIFDKICADLYNNFKNKMSWDVFPDVVPALEELHQKGVKLGVISNFDERLTAILQELKLKQFFSFIIPSRETAFYKPLPEIFHYAFSLANISPAEALHVGDNLNRDYKAARKAGMGAFVLLRQPTHAYINRLLESNVQVQEIIYNLDTLCDQIAEVKQ